jgi:hypothetical protein
MCVRNYTPAAERERVASRLRHRFNFEIMNAPTTNPAAGKKMTRGFGANPARCHRTRVSHNAPLTIISRYTPMLTRWLAI